MQYTIETALEALIKKFPGYKVNKEDFKEEYPGVYNAIQDIEAEDKRNKDQEFIEQFGVEDYHLKKHYQLLTEEEIELQIEVDKKTARLFNIGYESYVDMQEEFTKYYDDVKVLLAYDYPYHLAYKIGNSIDDSEFIECSLYDNDIYKIINIYLKTGKKIHDV